MNAEDALNVVGHTGSDKFVSSLLQRGVFFGSICLQEAASNVTGGFVLPMVVLWYSIAIELDSHGASISVVGEEPCPIRACTRLRNQKLVRGTVNEELEVFLLPSDA